MMCKKLIFSAFLFFGFTFIAAAQCESCNENKDTNTFCYQNDKFTGYCATFKDGITSFELSKGKKKKNIPLTGGATLKDLVRISQNKKLKIKATDILFIQEGLKVWAVESRKIGLTYTDSGLGIKILKQGDEEAPAAGQRVRVHYSGFLANGKKFDSSVDRDEPFTFSLGKGQVIKGWDEGVAALKIGSKAILEIPADLGYGTRGAGGGVIPPNATLYFEIEVLGVE